MIKRQARLLARRLGDDRVSGSTLSENRSWAVLGGQDALRSASGAILVRFEVGYTNQFSLLTNGSEQRDSSEEVNAEAQKDGR